MPVNQKAQMRIGCLLRLMQEGRYPNFPMLLRELRKLDDAGGGNLYQKTIQREVKNLVEELHAPRPIHSNSSAGKVPIFEKGRNDFDRKFFGRDHLQTMVR